MKQLLILSGKGGTGKTTIAAAFISFSRCQAFADCDVDAPNLHLAMPHMKEASRSDYQGFDKALIRQDICIQCGLCLKHCRFHAIHLPRVDPYACEGCGVCAELCPVHAISMKKHISGSLMLYKAQRKVLSTAKLHMGSGATGKLVTAVKRQLLKEAGNEELVIIDGSPGIGCPVIASVSGVDMVLIVTEPTVCGMHDMQRILDTAAQFSVACAVLINKCDVHPGYVMEIETFCQDRKIPLIGKIPYDDTVVRAVNSLKTMADFPNSMAGRAMASAWEMVSGILKKGGDKACLPKQG